MSIPIFDGHNDLAWTARRHRDYSVEGIDGTASVGSELTVQTDLPKLRAGGVAAQFWSAWVDSDISGPPVVQATLEQIDFIHRMVARYPESFARAATASDVRAAMAAGRIASLIGVEGGHQIDRSLAVLRSYARLGMRYLTLTWSRNNDWADSGTDEPWHGGLTAFGREVVRELNRIGVLVDLAHVAPTTASDALDVSTAPVMVSHSGAGGVHAHARNLDDDLVRRIADGGGVYMVTFVPAFLSAERRAWEVAGQQGPPPVVDIGHVADHIDHVHRIAGAEGVGIGGDFDGSDWMPEGLEDVSGYPRLIDELRRRGWSEDDLERLGWRNALRVLESADPAYESFVAGA